MKTVIILTGGCMFFGDSMPPKKLTGVCIAMAGIVWYTQLKLKQQAATGAEKDQVCARARVCVHVRTRVSVLIAMAIIVWNTQLKQASTQLKQASTQLKQQAATGSSWCGEP